MGADKANHMERLRNMSIHGWLFDGCSYVFYGKQTLVNLPSGCFPVNKAKSYVN